MVEEVGSGAVDVLVGHDGSPEAAAVVQAAIELLGPRLGRLTQATVVPFDVAADGVARAAAALRRVAHKPQTPSADLEVLHGGRPRPSGRRAVEGHYDLLTIGTRGGGLAKAMLGRTATERLAARKCPCSWSVRRPRREGSGSSHSHLGVPLIEIVARFVAASVAQLRTDPTEGEDREHQESEE